MPIHRFAVELIRRADQAVWIGIGHHKLLNAPDVIRIRPAIGSVAVGEESHSRQRRHCHGILGAVGAVGEIPVRRLLLREIFQAVLDRLLGLRG